MIHYQSLSALEAVPGKRRPVHLRLASADPVDRSVAITDAFVQKAIRLDDVQRTELF